MRHCIHGLELSTTLDGRACIVTWPSAEAAVADIEATYRDPESLPPPPHEDRPMTAWVSEPLWLPPGTPVHIDVSGVRPPWGIVMGTAGTRSPTGGQVHIVQLATGESVAIVRALLTDVGKLLGPRIFETYKGRYRRDFHPGAYA